MQRFRVPGVGAYSSLDVAPSLKRTSPRATFGTSGREHPYNHNTAVGTTTAMRRSLADIRKIIVQPTEEAARPPSADGLNGLFDRLAG